MPDNYLKRLLFASAALTCVAMQGYSQDSHPDKQVYIAAGIPDSLKEDANSVVRYSDININVAGPGKEVKKVHRVVTILNEKADREAVMVLPYNKKYNTFSSIEMVVYDANGKEIKKYRKSDMYDGAAGDDETLVTDERFLAVRHTVAAYPVTVETAYEETISSYLDLGGWDIQEDEQAVQSSNCLVAIAGTEGFRYLNRNTGIKPTIGSADNKATYAWSVSNLKAIKLEEKAEPWRVFPAIYFGANNFEFYGMAGDFSSWQNFGKWIKTLNADVCTLTPERAAQIKQMTDSIKTDKGKVKFLYNYLQQNMRYVSVQLGIGGLRPFAASFVDQKKYGDCKALSNYMCALLKAVGIPSCYAIVNAEANQEPAEPSFPYNYFNHVILCVPFKADTTWLECTSSTEPFGKLSPFTENRRALLITEDGGKLVNTPRSMMLDNQFNSEVHLVLNADGGAKANVKILSTGVYRDDYIGISSLKTDEQKETIMHTLNIKQPIAFDINPGADKNGIKEMNLDLEYDKFCDIMAGDKQFYKPHAIDLVAFTVPVEEHRKSDYYFEQPIQKSCVTTIDLPTGFEVETLPVNQSLKFTYGSYDVKYVYDAAKNRVVSTAKFNITNQVIPAAKYAEMQVYLDAVAKAQNKKLVIRRKA